MKFTTTVIICLLIIIGCSPKHIYIHPTFKESNQYFLESAINQLDIVKELEGRISPRYNIAVISIENNPNLDQPIITMIEDHIITSLVNKNYNVVERENTAIQNFIKEGDKKYSLTLNASNEDLIKQNIGKNILEPGINFVKTQLNSAGILISYRVLEAGILYHDLPDNFDKKTRRPKKKSLFYPIKKIISKYSKKQNHTDFNSSNEKLMESTDKYEIREAMIRLHIRIHKTTTGEIVHATNLTSTLTDTIRQEYVHDLASFHYTFYPYKYPLINKKQNPKIKKLTSLKINQDEDLKSQDNTLSIKNSISITSRIGYGMNSGRQFGLVTGGSITFGNNRLGNIGGDLMYLLGPKFHTMSLSGFYERSIFNFIVLRGGLSYLKTGTESNIGAIAGGGIIFKIGNLIIIQPMGEISFGTGTNNIIGAHLNMGILF